MIYILKHGLVQYQINIDMGIEEFKILHAKGKEVLAIYSLNGEFIGIEEPAFLNTCEITSA